jgi:S1-C subfamily serine protease
MMKRIICLLLILFIAVPVYAANAHLVGYAATEGGDKYYFIPESIKTSDKSIFVSSMRDFGFARNGIYKRVTSMVFNPDAKQYKLLATASLGSNGKVIEKREFPEVVWHDIPVNSAAEALFLAVTRYIVQNPSPSQNQGQDQSYSNKKASATGFFITPNIVVTNNHVVSAAKQIEIIYNNEVKVAATVICTDPGSDLALLRVVGLEKIVCPLVIGKSSEIKEGTRIYTVGFPLPSYIGTTAKITEGLVSGITGYKGDLRQFEISASIQPGNSGGPLLNEKAEVIGVVAAELGRKFADKTGIIPQNVNFAIKSENIQNLLTSHSIRLNLPMYCHKSAISATDIMETAKKGIVRISVVKE